MSDESQQSKWRKAQIKAHHTEKNALTFIRKKLNEEGWRYIDFQSKKGFARTGIIDLVALKLDNKDPDKLRIILFQVKGGSPTMLQSCSLWNTGNSKSNFLLYHS